MTQENKGEPGKITPAEKARQLALQAKEERAERYGEWQERFRTVSETLAGKREELKEVQEGLDEIVDIEKEGTMSNELKELRASLQEGRGVLERRIKEDELALQAMEADPLHVEMAAAESAAKAEADHVQAEEEEALRKKERHEEIDRTMQNLDTAIREITQAMQVAKKREETIRSLRDEKMELDRKRVELARRVEDDIGGVLYALPEKQQRAIADAVAEARKNNVTIYASDLRPQESRIAYRPSASTLSEWFAAWREKVTPSVLPFVDKPLRALRAFEGDARLEKLREMTAQLQELSDKVEALFEDRKKTNVENLTRLLAPDGALMTLDWARLQNLYTGDLGKMKVEGKIQELDDLKRGFHFLLTDVGDELYQQFVRSKLNSRFRY